MWKRWADELPLWEAWFELNPPLEKWVANAAWQQTRAADRRAGTIYESDFYATEKEEAAAQTEKEMAQEAAKIETLWPTTGKTEPKHEVTKTTKGEKAGTR